jgi:hypothetical protein
VYRFNWPEYLELRDEKHEQDFGGENWEGTIKSNSNDTDFGCVNYLNCTCSRSLIRAQDVSCWSLLEMLLNLRFCDSREFVEQVNKSWLL